METNYNNIYILVVTDSNGAFDYDVFTTFDAAVKDMKEHYDNMLSELSNKYLEKDYYSVMWRDSCYIVDEYKSIQYDWHIISLEDKF